MGILLEVFRAAEVDSPGRPVSDETMAEREADRLMLALIDDPLHKSRVMVSVVRRSDTEYVVRHPHRYNGDAKRVDPHTGLQMRKNDPAMPDDGKWFYYHFTGSLDDSNWLDFAANFDAYGIAMSTT